MRTVIWKEAWMTLELARERVHAFSRVRVYVCACMCVISSWVAGCRQPGRDKLGWMEVALRVCAEGVCLCACVCSCREITSQRTWKCVFSCLPVQDSKEISRQPNIPPCVFPAKTGGGIPTSQSDATGSCLEWAALLHLIGSTHRMTQPPLLYIVTTKWVRFILQVQLKNVLTDKQVDLLNT